MPRDDLSIDFVKMAPSAEPQDPGLILDDWVHRTSNLHEEIRFLQDEIRDKDVAYNECLKNIEESDAKIQRWIRANGSAQPNPREDLLRATIRENFSKADHLTTDKVALSTKLQSLFDKHLRQLDGQIKLLYDRGEPGFTDPDEVPSVLRPSAANHSIPSTKYPAVAAASPINPLNPISNNAAPAATRPPPTAAAATTVISRPSKPPPSKPLIRNLQQSQLHGSNSAPATPAATATLKTKEKERESSVGPSRPKVGTPKAGTPAATARAGSAGPRAMTKAAAVRKSTTTHLPNKRPTHLRESEDDASGSDDDEEDEEGKKYCLCQHVSYGDMVACDNENCPYEWFHWACVGLKSEPQGRWFCPDCKSK